MIFYTKRLLRFLFFLIIFALLPSPGCRNAQTSDGDGGGDDPTFTSIPKYADLTPERAVIIDSLRNHFDRLYKSGFNGTVLFAEKGEVVFAKAYGFANLQTHDSLTMESAFQLASVSKPVTALAILMLKDEGKLNIDDSLRKYIPQLPYPGITIRHLLTHRSGLPNYMYFAEELWPDKATPMTNLDVIDLMVANNIKPYSLPDKRYNYCNTNFVLLAYIVERITGIRFEDFVRTRIFQPLNMKNSSIYNKNTSPENTNPVIGYPSTRHAAENTYMNGVVGDKGVYASAYDLLKLDQALYTDKLVSQATLREAFTPQHTDLRSHDNYGLGWRLDVSDSLNRAVYHTGWWKGFRTCFIRETDEKRTIIVLSNTTRASRFSTRELRGLF